MLRKAIPLALAVSALMLALASCATAPRELPPLRGISVLAETLTVVGGDGGYGVVSFSGRAGQRILITMVSQSGTMEPYGFLAPPDGEGTYTPESAAAANGENSAEVTLSQDGTYELTVFDGSNAGGEIRVRIELLQ